jgi:transposase
MMLEYLLKISNPKMEFSMPKPYSIDLREKIVTAYENQEGSMQKLAKRFQVSKNFVADLLKRFKETGQIAPKPHGGWKSSLS